MLQPWPGLPTVRLDGRDVVLADAEVQCQLSLHQPTLLSHCLRAGSANLDFHP